MTSPKHQSTTTGVRSYSRIGTALVIVLALFLFAVVPAKMFMDGSPVAGWLLLGLGFVLILLITLALTLPVKQREGGTYIARAATDLDPKTFDPTKDGLPW